MKILIIGKYHHKNEKGIIMICEYLKYEYKFGSKEDIQNYDVILMPTDPINTSLYPTKKFIFGPHFSVFPDHKLSNIYNKNNNSIYIQPSKWVTEIKSWNNINKILPLKVFCFPVDTNTFKPVTEERHKVFIYFKKRKQSELSFITTFLKTKNIDYHIFDYTKRYNEKDYLKYLQDSKYGIIIGRHESQGFAIEEALSCDVPLIIWNVSSMSQEEGCNYPTIPATIIPYWNEKCGEYFYKQTEFELTYNKFIDNLHTYKPREFILNNLSCEKCAKKFEILIS
jgi:hypothetical protein